MNKKSTTRHALFRATLKRCLFAVYVIATVVLLFEIAYRNYWVDFYKAEFKALNPELSEGPYLLVSGDSFSAHPEGYVEHLRDSIFRFSIVNASVSGTGMGQQRLFLPSRIKKFAPKVWIHQIYLGNDLSDIQHYTSSELSFTRKLYWRVSDYIRSLAFLNYRLGSFKSSTIRSESELQDRFFPNRYNPRQRLYFKAEPDLIGNSVFLQKGRQTQFDYLVKQLHQLKKRLPKDCKIIFLVVPHCAQVSSFYANNMKALGAQFEKDQDISSVNFPFVNNLREAFPNVTVVNALEWLQKKDQPDKRLYYKNDPHLNAAGQKVLYQQLKQVLDLPQFD